MLGIKSRIRNRRKSAVHLDYQAISNSRHHCTYLADSIFMCVVSLLAVYLFIRTSRTATLPHQKHGCSRMPAPMRSPRTVTVSKPTNFITRGQPNSRKNILTKKPTPEWVGWTVTGPSPAEGHLPWPGVLLVGELAQVPYYPQR